MFSYLTANTCISVTFVSFATGSQLVSQPFDYPLTVFDCFIQGCMVNFPVTLVIVNVGVSYRMVPTDESFNRRVWIGQDNILLLCREGNQGT